MAYGRLDVFWPDGKFDTFLLENPSVSVGRSSGCTIVLDTDTISRYHISITRQGENVQLTDLDSANGTFMDGIRLKSNEAYPIQGGEELQIGHLRMIYHHLDEDTAPSSVMAGEETQRFEREELGFHIEIYGPEIAVPPGSHTSVEISIYNNTHAEQRYTVQVRGLPENWARVNRPQLLIDADDSAPVLVNIKPLRHSESKPGEYRMLVIVALKDEPERKIEAHVPVTILPFSGFGMALANRKISAYESFRLHVHNQGSSGLPIYVMGRSQDDRLLFSFPQQQLTLAPGERQVIQGAVKPARRSWFGQAKDEPFDLLVRSRDEASFLAAVRGHYINEPVMPTWAALATAGAGITVVVLMLVALALILLSPPTAPQILAFSANQDSMAQGETLQLSWSVEDAESVEVHVNGEPLGVPSNVSSVEVDTTLYSGDMVFSLIARNGDQETIQGLSVTVYEPLQVAYFEVTPQILVRNVVQQINVRWRVEQAITTRIQGLESLGPVSIEPSYGVEGDLSVSGIPTDNFVVTLYAEDENGNMLELPFNVDLVSPQCVVINGDLTLYASPSNAANVVSTLAEGTTLVVDGRDDTGAWLRTSQVGLPAWGARTSLDCDETFDAGALQIRIDPATQDLSNAVQPQVTLVPTFPTTLTPTPGN